MRLNDQPAYLHQTSIVRTRHRNDGTRGHEEGSQRLGWHRVEGGASSGAPNDLGPGWSVRGLEDEEQRRARAGGHEEREEGRPHECAEWPKPPTFGLRHGYG
jgi:hypothetical protein